MCIFEDENACTNCSFNVSMQDIQTFLETSNTSEVNFVLCSERVLLHRLVQFENKSFIEISTYEGFSKIICDNTDSGLKFSQIGTLVLNNIAILHCGVEYLSTSLNTTSGDTFVSFRSSVYIENSADINIINITIANSDGTGMAIIDTNGIILIENSRFEGNSVQSKDIAGGGGVYIEFSCPDAQDTCNTSDNDPLTSNSYYMIKNCTFSNNNASAVDEESVSYYRPSGNTFQGLGRGGGLCVHFRGHAENNTIDIHNCTFIDNSATWGGGLYISVRDSSVANNIHVYDSVLLINRATPNGGGGIGVGFQYFEPYESQRNTIGFHGCSIEGSSSEIGGGTYIFSSSSANLKDLRNEIIFEDCIWKRNKGKFGAAVNVATDIWNSFQTGYHPSFKFQDCLFESNYIVNDFGVTRHYKIEGKAAFIASGVIVDFEGSLNFTGNNDTALYLDSSSARFQEYSKVLFENNVGKSGGAVTILGHSSFEISDNSMFVFDSNNAREMGGAISQLSYSIYQYILSRSCFLHYMGTKSLADRNISFFFRNNRVGQGHEEDMASNVGHTIFSSSLHPCFIGCVELTLSHYDETFDCIANFTIENEQSNDISSIGEVVTQTDSKKKLTVIPGESIQLPISLKDDLNNSVVALYHITIMNNNNSSISIANDYTSNNWLQLFGNPGDTATLHGQTQAVWEVAFTINIRMRDCPVGFILDYAEINRSCHCATEYQCDAYKAIRSCNSSTFEATLRVGYWVTVDSMPWNSSNTTAQLVSSYCPIGYCNIVSQSMVLPNSTDWEEVDKLICGNRTGRLCAHCRGNRSTYYHVNSHKCDSNENCGIGWILLIVSEVIPITLFFFLIVICNVNFTGILNGLVFFFQLTDISIHLTSSFVHCPKGLSQLMDIYSFLTSIFNLKFFYHSSMSYCLWEGAQTLDLFMFRYLKIVYSLLLVMLIVCIQRTCLSKILARCVTVPKVSDTKSTIIHGLSGFLVICYSECTKLSLLILIPVTVYGENVTAVLFNGDFHYFRGKHLAYALPALFFLVVIGLGPVLLLLAYPLCYKIFSLFRISESKFVKVICIFIPLEKFKPFYDSFQSNFKDEYRFYSGLYFLYRLIILLTFAVTRSLTTFHIVIIVEFTVIICLHSSLQPYKKRLHNILDSFIFANLIIISILSFYSYRHALNLQQNDSSICAVCSVLTILYYLPLAVFVVICAKEVVVKLKTIKLRIRAKDEADISTDGYQLSESLLDGRKDSIGANNRY